MGERRGLQFLICAYHVFCGRGKMRVWIAINNPMREMSRMDPPRRFYSFNEAGSEGAGVDITGALILAVDGDVALPPLRACVVPGQVDDLLAAAPGLDRLLPTPPTPTSSSSMLVASPFPARPLFRDVCGALL
jgi:hypothetical protein